MEPETELDSYTRKLKGPTWYKQNSSCLNHFMQVQADILLSAQAGLDLLQMH